jgi:hypothetical protein
MPSRYLNLDPCQVVKGSLRSNGAFHVCYPRRPATAILSTPPVVPRFDPTFYLPPVHDILSPTRRCTKRAKDVHLLTDRKTIKNVPSFDGSIVRVQCDQQRPERDYQVRNGNGNTASGVILITVSSTAGISMGVFRPCLLCHHSTPKKVSRTRGPRDLIYYIQSECRYESRLHTNVSPG